MKIEVSEKSFALQWYPTAEGSIQTYRHKGSHKGIFTAKEIETPLGRMIELVEYDIAKANAYLKKRNVK